MLPFRGAFCWTLKVSMLHVTEAHSFSIFGSRRSSKKLNHKSYGRSLTTTQRDFSGGAAAEYETDAGPTVKVSLENLKYSVGDMSAGNPRWCILRILR